MMKQLFAVAIGSILLTSCGNSDQPGAPLTNEERKEAMTDSSRYTSIEWLGGTFQDMGKVVDGQVVEVGFRFRNTGTTPLIFESVEPSCGCTAPEKPERPYAPGEEGVIKAKFDSRGRPGPNEKYVTVKANTRPSAQHVLSFRVLVAADKKD